MVDYFDFEKPIKDLSEKIESLSSNKVIDQNLIENYKKEKENLYKKIYSNLTSWEKVQVARHPNRPHTVDYINNTFAQGFSTQEKQYVLMSLGKLNQNVGTNILLQGELLLS